MTIKNNAQVRSYNFKVGSTIITCNYTAILKVVLPKLHPTDLIAMPFLIVCCLFCTNLTCIHAHILCNSALLLRLRPLIN